MLTPAANESVVDSCKRGLDLIEQLVVSNSFAAPEAAEILETMAAGLSIADLANDGMVDAAHFYLASAAVFSLSRVDIIEQAICDIHGFTRHSSIDQNTKIFILLLGKIIISSNIKTSEYFNINIRPMLSC